MKTLAHKHTPSVAGRLFAIVAGVFRVLGIILVGLWKVRTAIANAGDLSEEDKAELDREYEARQEFDHELDRRYSYRYRHLPGNTHYDDYCEDG